LKVILFGATGMVGQGVLRECLLHPEVTEVLAIGRSETGQKNPKLREIIHKDLGDLSAIESELSDADACFFCLGVSSAGKTEDDYRRVTFDYTIAAAQALARQNPGLVFVFVSGAGTDSTERGRSMWARVKGKTENALLQMPFIDAYMFRPGIILPVHGEVSKTKSYRIMYAVMSPLFRLWKLLFPRQVVTTEQIGLAMLQIAKQGSPTRVLGSRDIQTLLSGEKAKGALKA
jgi:uncharacterized protein YbjT (DUF2867 family)